MRWVGVVVVVVVVVVGVGWGEGCVRRLQVFREPGAVQGSLSTGGSRSVDLGA